MIFLKLKFAEIIYAPTKLLNSGPIHETIEQKQRVRG